MPRTRSLTWSELKIGILAIAAILIAGTLILTLSGQGGFFWQRYALKTKFANAGGVKAGSPVRVAGVGVGSVKGLRFVGAEVEVDMELSRAIQDRVRTDSRAIIGSVSLLGEGAVDITASTTGEPIPEGGYVTPGPAVAQLSDVTAKANTGIARLTELINDVHAGKGTVGQLFTDESLYRDLQAFVGAARDVTQSLQKGDGTIGQLLRNPATAKQLETSLTNLSTITSKLNSGQGSLGQLINDEAFAKSLTSVTAGFDILAARMNRGEGTAGKLMTDNTLFDRLNAVASQFEQIATRLNQGQGTAGQLLQDKQLYENINKTATELQGLLADIRKDPKKFLTARISIF